jgi:hypothetical protein
MLTGKYLFSWNLTTCEPSWPDPWRVVSACAHAGVASLLIKVSDGAGVFNEDRSKDPSDPLYQAPVKRLVAACLEMGIRPVGWGFVYGPADNAGNPFSLAHATAEGEKLGEQCRDLGMAECWIDAEGSFEQSGPDGEPAVYAKAICEALKGVYSGPLCLSSFWKPQVHSALPWHTFCAEIAERGNGAVSPQVYPEGPADPGPMLRESHDEFTGYLEAYPGLQFFPTCAINADDGGGNAAGVKNFCATADSLGLRGGAAWVLDEAIPSMTAAFAAWTPKGPTP